MSTVDFTFLIDGVPYRVQAQPFDFNNEKRFNVKYDGNEYVFAYDSSLGKYTSLGDDANAMPDTLENDLAERLENYRRA